MPEWHSIQFVWPRLLWALGLMPVFWGLYLVWQRSRTRSSSSWFGLAGLATTDAPWRRRVPLALIFGGLGCLLVAVARPQAVLLLPSRMDTVMLAIDSSGSMRAGDVPPSRIEAAQAAARSFVLGQTGQVKLGLVSVAGAAALVQAPTDQRDLVLQAIDSLSLQPGSAIGSGIVIALEAMLPGSGLDVRGLIDGDNRADPGTAPKPPPPPKMAPGSNTSVAIVLISDGQSNVGPDALKMAQVAADWGVRVYTVGVGTAQGAVLKAQGMQMRVKLEEAPLKMIAKITKAEYFSAQNAQELNQIYDAISTQIVLKKHRLTEVTALCALLGMLLVAWGSAWAWWRQGKII